MEGEEGEAPLLSDLLLLALGSRAVDVDSNKKVKEMDAFGITASPVFALIGILHTSGHGVF